MINNKLVIDGNPIPVSETRENLPSSSAALQVNNNMYFFRNDMYCKRPKNSYQKVNRIFLFSIIY